MTAGATPMSRPLEEVDAITAFMCRRDAGAPSGASLPNEFPFDKSSSAKGFLNEEEASFVWTLIVEGGDANESPE